MLNSYECHVITEYLSNMANRFDRESPEAGGVVDWLTENASLLGFDRRSFEVDSEPFDSREEMSAEEISILQLLLRYQTQPEIEDLLDTVANGRRRRFHHTALNLKNRLAAAALGISASTLRRRLAADAPLVRSGLVIVTTIRTSPRSNGCARWSGVRAAKRTCAGCCSAERIRPNSNGPTSTTWDKSAAMWKTFCEARSRPASGGVNVLIHGPPGTGKTEFCRVLAKRMDVELFSIGEADAVGGEPTRSERLGELRLAQSLLGRDSNSLLLFDEMDDLLSEDSMSFLLFSTPRRRRPRGAMSKVFMKRLLEVNIDED